MNRPLIVGIVIVAIGGIVYYIFQNKANPATTTAPPAPSQPSNSNAAQSTATATASAQPSVVPPAVTSTSATDTAKIIKVVNPFVSSTTVQTAPAASTPVNTMTLQQLVNTNQSPPVIVPPPSAPNQQGNASTSSGFTQPIVVSSPVTPVVIPPVTVSPAPATPAASTVQQLVNQLAQTPSSAQAPTSPAAIVQPSPTPQPSPVLQQLVLATGAVKNNFTTAVSGILIGGVPSTNLNGGNFTLLNKGATIGIKNTQTGLNTVIIQFANGFSGSPAVSINSGGSIYSLNAPVVSGYAAASAANLNTTITIPEVNIQDGFTITIG